MKETITQNKETITVHGPYTAILVGQCCVCHEYLYIKDGNSVFGISHGYCRDCADKLMNSGNTNSNTVS
jgi:hypothetical protein